MKRMLLAILAILPAGGCLFLDDSDDCDDEFSYCDRDRDCDRHSHPRRSKHKKEKEISKPGVIKVYEPAK